MISLSLDLIFVVLASGPGIDLGDPAPAKPPTPLASAPAPEHAGSAPASPPPPVKADLGSLPDDVASLHRDLAALRAEVSGLSAALERRAATSAPAPFPVRPMPQPPPRERTAEYCLADGTGKLWKDTDPDRLKRWVARRDREAAAPASTVRKATSTQTMPVSSVAPSFSTTQTVTPIPSYPIMPSYEVMQGSSFGVPVSSFGGSFLGGGACVGGSCR
jgi:hypothetical protein